MATKIWAHLVGDVVVEMRTFDEKLEPGKHLPKIWTDDVSVIAGIAVGWVKNATGTFAAPAVDLAPLRAGRTEEIKRACVSAIVGGFASSALGAEHRYGSSGSDQSNLDADMMAAATNSAETAILACSADAGETWVAVAHSASQIAHVWKDFRAFRIACQTKKATLVAEVTAAATAEAIAAIVWA